ncbi:MAG: hypothetical protein V4526_00360 [Patescibacteria group bacterium]
MKTNIYQKVCLLFYIALVIFWIVLYTSGSTDGFSNYLYSFLFGLIPFFGGIAAMINSRRDWGGLSSAVGKATFFVGLGIFLWGCGEIIWSYYNFFLNVPAPYPSLADIGFAPSIFFYGLGAMYLSKATGAKFGLRSKMAKVFVIVAPILVLILSYYLLIVVARGGVLVPEGEPLLKALLDIIYPLGDLIALMIGVIVSGLSFKYVGGAFKFDVISLLCGLGVMYVADTVFSYTTTAGTYYNGNWGDLLLTTGLFLITYGILGFHKLKVPTSQAATR